MDAFERHDVSQLLAQLGVALTATVLNCEVALFGHHRLVRLGQEFFGQGRDVGHAAGERNYLGS